MIDVLLAEDHEIVREGFRAILDEDLDFRITGETGDGLQVLPLVGDQHPDVLVLDLMLPGLHGLEILNRIAEHHADVEVVVLSMHADEHYIQEAFRRGARGYVLKDSPADVLKDAIRAAVRGERLLDPALPADLLHRPAPPPEDDDGLDPYSFLTDREREVLQLTAEGLSLKETGERLHISPRTVEKHRTSILDKLGLRNVAEVVRFAVYRGLLGPPPSAPDAS